MVIGHCMFLIHPKGPIYKSYSYVNQIDTIKELHQKQTCALIYT